MSDLGFQLKQYESFSKTTEDINNSIINLKKNFLFKQNPAANKKYKLPHREVKLAVSKITELLDFVIGIQKEEGISTNHPIPGSVLKKFKIGFTDLHGLKAIKKALESKKILQESEFDLLDKIVKTFDLERTRLFQAIRKRIE